MLTHEPNILVQIFWPTLTGSSESLRTRSIFYKLLCVTQIMTDCEKLIRLVGEHFWDLAM
jgi:hypothetical protein